MENLIAMNLLYIYYYIFSTYHNKERKYIQSHYTYFYENVNSSGPHLPKRPKTGFSQTVHAVWENKRELLTTMYILYMLATRAFFLRK